MSQRDPSNYTPVLGAPDPLGAPDESALPGADEEHGAPRDWAALIFRPLVISGMVTCVAAAWIMSLKLLLPDWRGDYLVALVAVITLEMLLLEQQLRRRRMWIAEPWQIRLAQLGLILLLLKPASYVQRGAVAFLTEAQVWLRQPSAFFDGDYILGMVVVLIMWLLAMDIAGQLAAIQTAFNFAEREAGLSALKERFMLGALVLLAAVGAQRIDYSIIGLRVRATPGTAVTWLPLVYVGLGLLLFGQARLEILLSSWRREQIAVPPTLARRWAGWGALFVLGVMAVAWFLPAGDTVLGFYLLLWLMGIAALIGQVVIFILFIVLGLLLSPCLALFKVQQMMPPAQPQVPPVMLEPPPAEAGPAWLFYLKIVVFWFVVIVIITVLLRIYWRERRAVGGWGLWRGFFKLWQALWAWLAGVRERVAIRFSRSSPAQSVPVPGTEPGWWQFWQARTARERVRRLYLALLQRAAQAGHPRRAQQTPAEYAATLKPHVPGDEGALDALTGAFVAARYSRQDFEPDQVSLLRRLWRRLQARLRPR